MKFIFDPLTRQLRRKDIAPLPPMGGGGASSSSSGGGAPLETLNEGVSLSTTTGSIDFVGAGVNATASGNDITVTINGGGGGGHTVQEDGSDLTQRTNLNFESGLVASDDAGDDATNVNVANLGVSHLAGSAVVTEAEGLTSSDNDTSLPTTAAVVDALAGKANTSHTHTKTDLTDIADFLLESEVDTDIKTLSLPASTTITAAAATALDDATVGDMVNTLGGATSTGTGGLVRRDSPTFTTAVTLPTGLTGVIRADSGVVSVDTDVTDIVTAADTSTAGKVELATDAEALAGTDTTRAITPSNLASLVSPSWNPADALTYVSANTATMSGDQTDKYHLGDKIKLEQTATLTAHYKFESGDLTADSTGNGHTLSAISDPAAASVRFGNGITLDGNDAYSATDHANFKPTGAFTVGIWFDNATAATTQGLIQSYSANTNIAGWRIYINNVDTVSCTSGANTGTTLNTHYVNPNGKTTVTDGKKHWAVMTWDTAKVRLFVDGKLEAETPWTTAPGYAASNYVRIGCLNNAASDVFFNTGDIGETFFMNGRALTEGEIYAEYCRGAALNASTTSMIVTKPFKITSAVYDGTDTLFYLFGSNNATVLTNASISNPYYSRDANPLGFQNADRCWMIELYDDNSSGRFQSNPDGSTFYNPGSLSITLVPGMWDLTWEVVLRAQSDAAQTGLNAFFALSTANNAFTDGLPQKVRDYVKGDYVLGGASSTLEIRLPGVASKLGISIGTSVTFYAICWSTSGTAVMNSLGFDTGNTPLKIRAVLAWK